ncbi:MAG: MFS transporter [Actinomycetales bacterium]|nr:MFS transporter [Actinomycetales bacterium]
MTLPHAGPTTTHGRDPVQTRTVGVLAGVQVLVGVGTATGAAVNSLVAAELSGSETVGGLAQTCVVVGSALAALPIAQVAARHGRRRSLVLGYGVAMLGALGATAATVLGSTALLLAGMTFIGAGGAAGLAARFAATDLAAPEHRARALSLVVWAATVGSVLGPNLAGWLDSWALGAGLLPAARGTHTAVTFALMAAMFALAALTVALLLRPDPLMLARERSGEDPPAPSSPWRSVGTGIRVIRALPSAQVGLLGIVVSHLVMVSLMVMTPVHMNHHGASLQLIGLVISLHIAGMFALSPLFGVATDRFGAVPVLVAGGVILAGAAALVIGVPGHGGGRLTAGLVLLGVGWSAGLVAGSSLLTGEVPAEHRTTVQGASDVAMNLGGALGGVVAGVAVTVASYGALAVVSLVIVAGYLAVVLIARPGARRSRTPAGA